jgi:L-asparagine oxygenase
MMDGDIPVEYCLSSIEADEIDALTAELRDRGEDPATARFYDRCRAAAARMPRGLRSFAEYFRDTEPASAALIHGFTVDDSAIGPTPTHWETATGARAALDQELQLALCGLLLGEPFAWATLQDSRLVQNILPVPGDENCQNGYGSSALLEFHTEDGFHPQRCDYLMLFGIRNYDKVATTIASIRDVKLSARDKEVLSQPLFHILPDDEHVRQLELRDPAHPALDRVRQMRAAPEPVAVLTGDADSPYLRIDLPFMRCVNDDPDARRALAALAAEFSAEQQDVVVESGALLVIDNYLAVHGRQSFSPRYDGTDRWLKKLTVSRNLRIHAGLSSASNRVLI